MFKLKKPCKSCPWKRGQGSKFRLPGERITEIVNADAFQCHATVDYSDDEPQQGNKPQQCAGLIAMMHKDGKYNRITQVAMRIAGFDPVTLDGNDVYDGIEQARAAHRGEEP